MLSGCQKETKFGKQYNSVRLKYGSPIIHDYLEFEYGDSDRECWGIPKAVHDTISIGFHEGKCFNIGDDSVLYEDDIFRKRINDSTFLFVAIITYGNPKSHYYKAIYYDTVDIRSLNISTSSYLSKDNRYKEYYDNDAQDLTIEQADSILTAWGTSRSE